MQHQNINPTKIILNKKIKFIIKMLLIYRRLNSNPKIKGWYNR